MAEGQPAKRSLFSRVRTLAGTAFGLLSGAAIMYVSPLVDRVVKPGKPLANFAVETDGLTATFQNRYAGEGWWDFGDGSQLEPAMPDQESIAHTFPRPGTYTVKLTVRNYIGEEHERATPIEVTAQSSASTAAPAIAAFDAIPVSSDRAAPATYRLVAQTANAERCLWDLGPEKGLDVVTESLGRQERFVTFAAPGQHVIQLTALAGNQAVRRALTLQVDPPRGDSFVARLLVSDRGSRVEKRQFTDTVPVTLSRNSRSTLPIDRKIAARGGFKIVDARFGHVDPAFSNMKLALSPDGRSVQITGSLTPTAAIIQAPLPPAIPVILTQERPVKVGGTPAEIDAAVPIPGSITLPLPAAPAGATQAERSLVLELRGPNGQAWHQPLPARPSLIEYQNRRLLLTTTASDKEVRVELAPASAGLTSQMK